MENARLYIVQVLGILVLLCGYFLSDQPDSLSIMHFDSNPACPSVFSKAVKSNTIDGSVQTLTSSQDHPSKKSNVPKHISFEIILPHTTCYTYREIVPVTYTSPLQENYNYLFYKEINPPPPKVC